MQTAFGLHFAQNSPASTKRPDRQDALRQKVVALARWLTFPKAAPFAQPTCRVRISRTDYP